MTTNTIFDLGKQQTIHMIGINGVSMSGLALFLLHFGYQVSGYDLQSSQRTDRLQKKGVAITHDVTTAEQLLKNASAVIYTAAIKPDHPQRIAAKTYGLPQIDRAVLLGEIMSLYQNKIAVTGTHGKSTVTSMLSTIFLYANKNPGIHIGAHLEAIKGTVSMGERDYFITEADEYNHSFYALDADAIVATNIEYDHPDFFSDLDAVKKAYLTFFNKRTDRTVIVNNDCTNTRDLLKDIHPPVITFGQYGNPDIRMQNFRHTKKGTQFDLTLSKKAPIRVNVGVLGLHNAQNALAALACANQYNIELSDAANALSCFTGAKRRLEYKGTYQEAAVYDDFAHHPTEIKAALAALAPMPKKRLIVVFQSHTYSRTRTLLTPIAQALCSADQVIVADIYAAREDYDGVTNAHALVEKINTFKCCAAYVGDFDCIVAALKRDVRPDDLIVTMGAGNIDQVANSLVN